MLHSWNQSATGGNPVRGTTGKLVARSEERNRETIPRILSFQVKFEVLDARIASALNMVIENSYIKKKVSLEEQKAQKEGRFFRGTQIAHMIYDCFRVIGAHDTVLDCTDLLTITLRNDDVKEFDTRWDEILLSLTKIPPDDVLESLYKLTVLELYDMEIHQKISMPDYRKLKTMLKRSTDQKLSL